MKLILSRKGFDLGNGGVASPILPDNTLLSLPIPDPASPIAYADLKSGDWPLGGLVESLTRKRIKRQTRAHLDPDLDHGICPRLAGWQPLFGQDGAAQSHLRNQGVSVGDLFLFFGWFRAVQRVGRGFRYCATAPDQHVVYGWLQVGQMLQGRALATAVPAWAVDHPHCHGSRGKQNTLYLAAPRLTLPGGIVPGQLSGAGRFPAHHNKLVLTAPGAPRSHWRLPRWFYPTGERPPLTYHGDRRRWQLDGEHLHLRSAARGQEFVLDTANYPAALPWLHELFATGAAPRPRKL